MQVPPSQQLLQSENDVQSESDDWPAAVSATMHSVSFTLPNIPLPNVSNLPGAASVNNVTSRIATGVGNVTSRIAAGAGNVTSRIADAVHLPNISNVHLPRLGLAPRANNSEAEVGNTLGVNGSEVAPPHASKDLAAEEVPESETLANVAVEVAPDGDLAGEDFVDEDLGPDATASGNEDPAAEDAPPATRDPSEQESGIDVEHAEPAWELERKLALAAVGLKKIGGPDVTEEAQNVLQAASILDSVKDVTAAVRNATQKRLGDAIGNVSATVQNVSGRVNLSAVVHVVQNATRNLLEDYLPHLLDAVGPFLSPELARKHGMLVRVGDIYEATGVRGEEMSMGERSFQGDMVADSDEQLQLFQEIIAGKRGPYVAAGKPWKDGHVKYCFASDVEQEVKSRFSVAVQQIERATCLTFEDVGWLAGDSTMTSSEQQCNAQPAIFVMSRPNYGCYSVVGESWQPSQQLQLQHPGCTSQGVIMHELGHAIGMAHEHSRPDRDEFIKVNWDNIQDKWASQFDISPDSYVGVPYAYLSLMHYDPYAFSKDRHSLPTIEASPGHNTDIGQRNGFAQEDISQIIKMYESEVANCSGNPINGTGCVNMPGDDGGDICSGLLACGGITNERCCACGGGVEVQCYAGEVCPSGGPQLPRDNRRDCLVDQTHLWLAHGDASPDETCIVHNMCDTKLKFKCQAASCTHSSNGGAYQSDFCHGEPTMQICTNPELCEVWDVVEEAMYSPADPVQSSKATSTEATSTDEESQGSHMGDIGAYVAPVTLTAAVFAVGFALHSYLTAAGTVAAAA